MLQYFISTHGARKGLADTALKTANSGYLTRRLVDVTQDLVVTEDDCETTNGVVLRALVEGGEVVEALRERILGRVLASDILHPETQDVLFPAGTLLDEDERRDDRGARHRRGEGPHPAHLRHPLGPVQPSATGATSDAAFSVNVGEAVGVIAAQSIGEPGTQLTMRTFHIGGAASRTAVASQVEAKSAGVARLHGADALRHQRQGRAGRDLAAPARCWSPTTTAASASATRCRTARRSRSATAPRSRRARCSRSGTRTRGRSSPSTPAR